MKLSNFKEKTLKILVAGHVGAGKTTFVTTVSQIPVLKTEAKLSRQEEKPVSPTTTVAFDFGKINDEQKLAIFGIPGQRRFSFMWKTLIKGTLGYIFMFDSTNPALWKDTMEQFEMFMDINPVPFVFVANKQDLPNALKPENIRQSLRIPEEVPVVPCIALDRTSTRETLAVLLQLMKKFCGDDNVG
ncbi:MAG: GTP-binding protein [Aquifex sp.]|nr:MAG: GTP-binding protein [Aquifex sp.]